jgi:hypothetical protein
MNRESQIAIATHAPLFAEARGDIQVSFEFSRPNPTPWRKRCGDRSKRWHR